MTIAIHLSLITLVLASYTSFMYRLERLWHKLLISAGLVLLALLYGFLVLDLTAVDIGLVVSLKGLLYGLTSWLVVAIGLSIAPSFKSVVAAAEDERSRALSPRDIARKVALEVPLVTVITEEIVFRGIILGWLLVELHTLSALIISSFLFGLWHIPSSLHLAQSNKEAQKRKLATILATVIFTFAAGFVFGGLRVLSGSLIAPIMLHYGVNSGSFILSWHLSREKS